MTYMYIYIYIYFNKPLISLLEAKAYLPAYLTILQHPDSVVIVIGSLSPAQPVAPFSNMD